MTSCNYENMRNSIVLSTASQEIIIHNHVSELNVSTHGYFVMGRPNCQTARLEEFQTARLSEWQIKQLSEHQTVRLPVRPVRPVRLNDYQNNILSYCHTLRVSDMICLICLIDLLKKYIHLDYLNFSLLLGLPEGRPL